MFDLVVETAHEVVHEQPAANVAAGQHLATQEVHLYAGRNLGHAFVVWCKRCAHVNAKEGHVDDEEDRGDIPGHQRNENDGVTNVPGQEKSDFRAAVVERLSGEHSPEGLNVKVETLEGQDWEEQPALTLHESVREASGLGCRFFLEHDEVGFNVGVFAHGVGVCVVSGVFAHPPGVTDANNCVCQNASSAIVRGSRGEHLAVGGFVGDKGKLGHDDRHHGCER